MIIDIIITLLRFSIFFAYDKIHAHYDVLAAIICLLLRHCCYAIIIIVADIIDIIYLRATLYYAIFAAAIITMMIRKDIITDFRYMRYTLPLMPAC